MNSGTGGTGQTGPREQSVIQGAWPGHRYEATWGRKRVNSATFIARVYYAEPGGGVELYACDHKHPTKTEAHSCARDWAAAAARRDGAQRAAEPDPSTQAADLRDAVRNFLGEFGLTCMEFR